MLNRLFFDRAQVYVCRTVVAVMIFTTGIGDCLSAAKPDQGVMRIAADTFEIQGGSLPERQPDGNSYLIAAPQGLVVVDTGRHPFHLQHIEAFAAAANKPVTAIINTHWHLDHVSGNVGLRARFPDLQVYASDAADLDTVEHGAALRPDIVIDHDERLTIAGRPLEFHLARNAATAGDVWVVDRATQIAFVGDLVTFPAPFFDTACPDGWLSALTEIVGSGAEVFAPGHGPVLDRLKFEAYRSAFAYLNQCIHGTDAPEACATEWAQRVGQIVKMKKDERRLAAEMTQRYVADVLRPNGGNSAFCSAKR